VSAIDSKRYQERILKRLQERCPEVEIIATAERNRWSIRGRRQGVERSFLVRARDTFERAYDAAIKAGIIRRAQV
jgi:ribosome modulation factor